MVARFCGIRLHRASADEFHTSADEKCSQGKRKLLAVHRKKACIAVLNTVE